MCSMARAGDLVRGQEYLIQYSNGKRAIAIWDGRFFKVKNPQSQEGGVDEPSPAALQSPASNSQQSMVGAAGDPEAMARGGTVENKLKRNAVAMNMATVNNARPLHEESPVEPSTSYEVERSYKRPRPTPPNPGGTASAELEKYKLIQRQLVLLFHAHKCQRIEQTNGKIRPCALPHCGTMKSVLTHMTTCMAGKDCPTSHCVSSRHMIDHWKNCARNDCPVCVPLRPHFDNSAQLPSTTPQPQTTPGAPPTAAEWKKAYQALDDPVDPDKGPDS